MSDYGDALARAQSLKRHLEARGVRTSIEIMQGRPGTPHTRWYDTRFIGSMGHHIVSTRSQGLTPGLKLVKTGRTDVPGPLCNGYLGFDLVARIICMGWANHPGAGGPYTLPGGTIPRDAARPYLFGWEIEGGVREADWTTDMRRVMGKCHAATLDWLNRDERSHIEHKTWAPTRKIDRLNYTLSEARAELKPYLTVAPPTPPEDDMPSPSEWTEKDNEHVRNLLVSALSYPTIVPAPNGERWNVVHSLDWLMRMAYPVQSLIKQAITEAADDPAVPVELSPEQIAALSDAVAAKVERVTVTVQEGQTPPPPSS